LDHYDEIWCMTVQDGLEHTQLSSSSATSSSSAATAGRLPGRVFGQHAGPVCQLLEASTRCKTDTPVKDAVTSTSGIHGVDPVLILACGTTTVLQLQQPTYVSIGAVLFTAAVKAKAGSTLRLHFYGLLVSACKLLETDSNRLTAPDVLCGELCDKLCDATGSFIHSAVLSSNPPAAAEVVPWLALLGRLCLLVADRVRTAHPCPQTQPQVIPVASLMLQQQMHHRTPSRKRTRCISAAALPAAA
jgi:hypothetical protein